MKSSGTNRLIHEKSPYLRQHARNPVDWFPWGKAAFDKARRDNLPIFLSIGYATCHWCHVMERESFEDPDVARLMNDNFVSVKVDREERPDLDSIYMTVCQMLTGSGGWPLTVILTPSLKPFFAGTYFPRQSQYGRIGMLDLIPRIRQNWRVDRQNLERTSSDIVQAMQRQGRSASGSMTAQLMIDGALDRLTQQFEPRYGGFSPAPKFPSPHTLLFLLHTWRRSGSSEVMQMVEKTLDGMLMGGIYDHAGFGFHRYATDIRWLVPHFEKMLYDQAMLIWAFTEAYQAFDKPEYLQAAVETAEYVRREMTDPAGGFYSAQDADSDGIEGQFYLWTLDELRAILSPDDAKVAQMLFNLREDGNCTLHEGPPRANILHLTEFLPDLAAKWGGPEADLQVTKARIVRTIYEYRQSRIPPFKDDKILTDWNGLMITALAHLSRLPGQEVWLDVAEKACGFILSNMRQSGELLHRYRDGEAGIPGKLDDYAFFCQGLLAVYQASFKPVHLQAARDLTHTMIRLFWDEANGGLFLSPADAEDLIIRPKDFYDGAIPSGNSVCAMNFLVLGRLTGDPQWDAYFTTLSKAVFAQAGEYASGVTQFLCALNFAAGPSCDVVIAGRSGSPETAAVIQAVNSVYQPDKTVILAPQDNPESLIFKINPELKKYKTVPGKAQAYICRQFACHDPTDDPVRIEALLLGQD